MNTSTQHQRGATLHVGMTKMDEQSVARADPRLREWAEDVVRSVAELDDRVRLHATDDDPEGFYEVDRFLDSGLLDLTTRAQAMYDRMLYVRAAWGVMTAVQQTPGGRRDAILQRYLGEVEDIAHGFVGSSMGAAAVLLAKEGDDADLQYNFDRDALAVAAKNPNPRHALMMLLARTIIEEDLRAVGTVMILENHGGFLGRGTRNPWIRRRQPLRRG
jgi:hypothetical protein